MSHKLYLPYVKLKKLTSNAQGEKLSANRVKYAISPFELHFYTNEFYLNLCRDHPRE